MYSYKYVQHANVYRKMILTWKEKEMNKDAKIRQIAD